MKPVDLADLARTHVVEGPVQITAKGLMTIARRIGIPETDIRAVAERRATEARSALALRRPQ